MRHEWAIYAVDNRELGQAVRVLCHGRGVPRLFVSERAARRHLADHVPPVGGCSHVVATWERPRPRPAYRPESQGELFA